MKFSEMPSVVMAQFGSLALAWRRMSASIFPHALEAVATLVNLEIPVVGGGGIYDMDQVETMLAAGAKAVQLDTALWRGGLV